ncbi:hypothetical protein KQI42_19090 [Tissierella sp. MSJ-40]|uniref:Uncharacterized protein n=1 Tax=Tissierella simiarum TaxID=2841534 RepID=A0ABS6EAY8_9FIRM|nr:hypothetical protein [Tissierella simiarum]MBU5440103.1 hypothetical protein [Tissierella simiarum]
MKISISDEIYSIFLKTTLGILSYRASVVLSSKEFIKLFQDMIDKLSQEYRNADDLDYWMEKFSLYFTNYCGVMKVEKWIV